MFGIENKNNTGKFLVAVLAILMVFAAATVLVSSDESSAAEVSSSDLIGMADTNKVITLKDNTVVNEAVTLDGYTIECGSYTITFKGNVNGGENGLVLNGSALEFVSFNTAEASSAGCSTVENVTINGTNAKAIVKINNSVALTNCTLNAPVNGVYTASVYAYSASQTVAFNNVVSNNALVRFCLDNGLIMTLKDSTLYGIAMMNGFSTGTEGATFGAADANLKIQDSDGKETTIGITCLGSPAGDSFPGADTDTDFTVSNGATYKTGSLIGAGNVTANGAETKIIADTTEVAIKTSNGAVAEIASTSTVKTLDEAQTMLGSVDEVTLSSSTPLTISADFTIAQNKTLNIVNTTINNAGEFSFLVSGNLNISNSYVYAGVDVNASSDDKIVGELTVSGAHTLSANGTGNTNLYVGVGDTLNFTGTIPSQRTVYVYGNLVATDITVAGTVKSYVGSTVTLNGAANISGDFIMDDADLEIAGTVNVRNDADGGADFQLNGKSAVTVLDTGVFNVNKPTAIAATGVNKLTIGADSTFTVEGTLNITGTLSGNVIDKGTVNFNGTSDNGSISLYNGVTLTVTSVSGKLVVNDSGAAEDVIGEKKYNNGANVSEGNVIELNNVRGVTISESITSETVKQTRYYYSNMEISGTFIVLDNNTADASVTIKAATNPVGAANDKKCGEIVYSGTSVIGAGVTVINQGELTVTGDISVTRSTATGTKSGIINNTDGKITVEGSIVMYDAQLAGIVNAMYYTITGTEATANYYTGFAAAIAAAGDADSNTVYVQGNVTVSETAEIAAGTYVSVGSGAELTIDEGVTLTVADTAALNVIGTVDVDGTLVITNTDTGLSYGTLEYDVYTVNGKTATYTNLANALANANPGDVITIAQDVTLGSSTTIPAEVTVQTGDNAIILKDNVTLTVEGTLAIQRNGELKADATASPALKWGTDVKLVVDGVVSSVDAAADTDMTQYKAAGAVFQIRNLYYLTTVEYAAGVSAQVEDNINVYGNVSYGDVVFTEGENNTLAINFNNIGTEDDTFRGNVTIDGATINVVTGLYTGNITAAAAGSNAVIALNGASKVTIDSSVNEEELEPVDVMTLGGIAGTAVGGVVPYIVEGNVTIQSGTVTAGKMDLGTTKNGTFTVASGATLLVGKDSSVGVNYTAEVGLTVDGTIAIDEGSFAVAANGTAVINGTMSVENTTGSDVSIAGTMVVAGTLDISAAEDTAAEIAVSGTLLVGAVPETLGQTTSGNVSGEVDLNASSGMIIVYTGSSIENIDVGNAEFITTKYYINETEYATAYTFSGQKTIVNGLGSIELDAVDFDNVNTKWYSDDAMTKEIADKNNALMTSYENVYISAPISERTGTISAGTGLDLYIDNIRWDATLGYKLAVGTHTVSFDVKAGYDGSNATITFNGQTVENGGTIEITANGFVLVANGAVPATSTSGGSTTSGSDDGLGLTDYLLIILVVLIVIMAIMVAMRLMRS